MIRRLIALAAALFCSAAMAYPDKPLRLIVPFPAGDGLDTQGRMIADRLGARLGQKVIVDNRPGAGTLIGVEAAKQAAGDGHTLLLVTTTYAINPALRLKVPYDPATDFLPVIQTTAIPLVVVGSPSFAPNNFAEVLALARQQPGKLTMGNSGMGTAAHVGMELLDSMAGIKFNHVAYKGIPPALTDLIGGQLQMLCTSPAQVMPMIREGKIKALAVTGANRMKLLPQVGTVQEAGVKDYVVTAWVGLMTRAGTPPAIVDRLNREIADILAQPDVAERLTADGSAIVANRPDEFGRHIAVELQKWEKTIREAGIPRQ
jgi:tripartite-type tricarboxylate transporter receptor subunit TctC